MTMTDDGTPIRYVDRTHAWYDALGYGNPYRYAQHDDAPFRVLGRPLAQSCLVLLTTAAPFRPEQGPQDAKAAYNAAAKFYTVYSGETAVDHDLRVSHVAVDRAHLSDDQNCWFPLPALRRAAARRRIGALSRHFLGIPTNRSQRHTIEVDAPEALARCRAEAADVALLVPNCPICHQTMSLIARHLESNGIPTIVMGAAKDIVEHCGVPRFLFSDVPLGNAAGLPYDVESQDDTLEWALKLLESAPGPRTTLQNPLHWPGPWRTDYMNLDALSPEDIAQFRAENDQLKQVAHAVRNATLAAT